MKCTRAFSLNLQLIILISFLIYCLCIHPALSQSLRGADCWKKQTCGNLTVKYPFKLKSEPNCSAFSPFFELECKGEELSLHNFTDGQVRVLQIHEDSLVVDVTGLRAVMKESGSGTCRDSSTFLALPDFPGGPFVIADDNVLGSFGCDSMATLTVWETHLNASTSQFLPSHEDISGCSVLCSDNEITPPECGGRKCCVSRLNPNTTIRRAYYTAINSPSIDDTTKFNSLRSCNENYATLFDPKFSTQSYGLKLTWALPDSTMDIQSGPNFACSNHSNISLVPEVPGYRCFCPRGFDGDGYSLGSPCSDINECENGSLNDCIPHESTCHNNQEGSYSCKCNSQFHVGDGMRNGSGCSFSPTLRNALVIIGVVCRSETFIAPLFEKAIMFFGLLIAGLLSFAIYWRRKIKKSYFLLNGGIQLEEIIKKAGGKQEMKCRLFTTKELKLATENYAEHMKLGMGGFGTVYKGVLADGRLVAIKKSNRVGQGGNYEFLNEMQILMQINHRNIVRLLGCCMETVVPLLVYEFVAHGNVRENLDLGDAGFMSWVQRLKVARQTAEALAYLHAAASPPILHRDVKSTNVLLDDNLDAKVADFGASRLVSDGVQHVSTGVQGTIGYLDPEYFQTLQLTDKSDVYSLGVMLVELITGLKPIDSQNRQPCFANLALLFINHMQEARGVELIDPRLEDPSTLPITKSWDLVMVRSSIMDVADLAWRCLSLHGHDRPSMSLLVDELHQITRSFDEFNNELDSNNDNSPLMPGKSEISKRHEAGVMLKKDDAYFVQSSSTSTSNSMSSDDIHIDLPTLPH